MRKIGFWMQDLDDTELIAPQEISGLLSDVDLPVVLAYLRSGQVFTRYLGVPYCDLTDGRWVWPGQFDNDVEKYRISLPEEFIRDAHRGQHQDFEPEKGQPDKTFWKDWCSQRRHPEYQKLLAEARLKRDRRFEKALAIEIRKIDKAMGTSNKPCAWAGCQHPATSVSALCSYHMIGEDGLRHLRESCGHLPEWEPD
ncbi:MAG: hypothetical protein JNN07_26130 [Verrucomicrobiales bacterium]|nr:hypothetical protein [Verrucomicrobiales bacterium]